MSDDLTTTVVELDARPVVVEERRAAATRLILRAIAWELSSFAFRYRNETHLHELLAEVLTKKKVDFEREYRIDGQNRFDFWLPASRIVLEVKVEGSLTPALRQIARYCTLDDVGGVLLATTERWGSVGLGPSATFHGKPVAMIRLSRPTL